MDDNSEEAKSIRKDFLHAMFADYLDVHGGYIETREIFSGGSVKPKFHKDIDSVINYRSASNFYVGMCPREIHGVGTVESIKYLVCLWSDVDYGEVGHKKKPKHKTLEEALAAIEAFPLKPSIIVSSGHGVYPIWLLKEPLEIKDPAYVKKILKAIEVHIGGDTVSDLPRILRPPGTKNYKIKDAVKDVVMLRFEPNRRYCLDDFELILPEEVSRNIQLLQAGQNTQFTSGTSSQNGQEGAQKTKDDSDEKGSRAFKIEDLKIPESAKHLIRVGKTAEDHFDSRSEADFYVLRELVKVGLMDEDIRKIFKEYAIGAKYREQGDAYLDYSIKKARSKVTMRASGQVGEALSDNELNELKALIQTIAADTDKILLPGVLDPILQAIAGHNIAQGDAILRHVIKDHFGLKENELKSYEKVLNGYRKEDKQDKQSDAPKSISKEELLERVREEQDHAMVHPAQDYADGRMVFTVKAQGTLCLITSDRDIFTFDDAKSQGLILKHDTVDTVRFSGKGIDDFVSGRYQVKAADIYKKIYNYVKRFIKFPAGAHLQYIVLWVMGTYVFMLFRYFPYVWINAEKGSGKSLTMEIIAGLAFNGDVITSPTEAVLYRDIENNLTSMFIDEFEKVTEKDKSVQAALGSILKAGFCKSGVVKRCESTGDGKFVVKSYSAYSPKMFAGISDIDNVLQDRTVRINLLRKKEDEDVDTYMDTEENGKYQQSIRDDLYVFALTYAKALSDRYQKSGADGIQGMAHLNNRELDIWRPILLIANQVDDEDPTLKVTATMSAWSEMAFEEKHADSVTENETYKVLTVLKAMFDDEDIRPSDVKGAVQIFMVPEVLSYFQKQESFESLETSNALTKKLKKVGVVSKQGTVGGRKQPTYQIDLAKFQDLWERYVRPGGQ